MKDSEKLIFAAAYVAYYDVEGDFGTAVHAVQEAVKMIDSLNKLNTSELSDHESKVLGEFRSDLPQDPETNPPST